MSEEDETDEHAALRVAAQLVAPHELRECMPFELTRSAGIVPAQGVGLGVVGAVASVVRRVDCFAAREFLPSFGAVLHP